MDSIAILSIKLSNVYEAKKEYDEALRKCLGNDLMDQEKELLERTYKAALAERVNEYKRTAKVLGQSDGCTESVLKDIYEMGDK